MERVTEEEIMNPVIFHIEKARNNVKLAQAKIFDALINRIDYESKSGYEYVLAHQRISEQNVQRLVDAGYTVEEVVREDKKVQKISW